MSGKGSTQRPVDRDKFNDNFDKIFKPKPKPPCASHSMQGKSPMPPD